MANPAPAAPSGNLEDRILAIPGLAAEPVDLFSRFVLEVMPRLTLPPMSLGILEAFSNIDVTSEKVGEFLRRNPYYEFQFLKVISTLSKREDTPSSEAAVVLMGMQRSRDLILGMQLYRTVKRSHPERDKDGKLLLNPQQTMKFALKTEELLSKNKDGYADTAYAGGMLFDALVLLAEAMMSDPKNVHAYIDLVYKHSLTTAKVEMNLAAQIPNFTHKKFAFSVGLIHDVGKIVMAILDPGYLKFLETCTEKDVTRQVRYYTELKNYGVTHAQIGAMVCRAFSFFKPVEPAILYHHDPYLIRKNKVMHQLACLTALASNIAANYKIIDKDDDPVVKFWKGPELVGFDFTVPKIREAILKASKDS